LKAVGFIPRRVWIVHADDLSGVRSVSESQLLEESVAIAWVFLQRSGELGDGYVAARFLTDKVDAMIRTGRRNRMFLANMAIIKYRESRRKVVPIRERARSWAFRSLELWTLVPVEQKRESAMRKVVSRLDDEQREALLELVDLGTAICSSGLIVATLMWVDSLFG
jgi:hypothetical protein